MFSKCGSEEVRDGRAGDGRLVTEADICGLRGRAGDQAERGRSRARQPLAGSSDRDLRGLAGENEEA